MKHASNQHSSPRCPNMLRAIFESIKQHARGHGLTHTDGAIGRKRPWCPFNGRSKHIHRPESLPPPPPAALYATQDSHLAAVRRTKAKRDER